MSQEIPFIEYVRPRGQRNQVAFPVPDDVAKKAHALIDDGYQFEIELLGDGVSVSLAVSLVPGDSFDLARRICTNGPALSGQIAALVEDAWRSEQRHALDPAPYIISQYESYNTMPAFDEGREAYGKQRDCPYAGDSVDGQAWDRGLEAAMRIQRILDRARPDQHTQTRCSFPQP